MDTEIFAVRIGDKYGMEYEKYQESKLGRINWIRYEDRGINLWWNRMKVFGIKRDYPVIIIDIDMLWINDYLKIIDYPVERGEFLTTRNWWGMDQPSKKEYTFSGGFYKFWPEDTAYISKLFYTRPDHWQQNYINLGIAQGPVGGEMNFVEDAVKKKLKIKYIPEEWNGQAPKMTKELQATYNSKYKNDWYYLDGEFHPDLKVIHYQGWHDSGVYEIPQVYLKSQGT